MERRSSTSVDCNTKDSNNANGKPEGTEYIPARCRITKPNPPKPAQNPLQFVKVGPCDLYRSAQEQLKKVEVIKKIKQEFKEDGEDWQANLDNWKSSRRKRQEHIIERVVEIRNMEQENEKSRRRSKTFSEMMEDRNRRRKLSNLTLYTGDDGNDLSDLGISTPSRKGSISGDSNATDDTANSLNNLQKDSLNEPDNINSEKTLSNGNLNSNNKYEEYTYEGAIQGYKSRVKRRSFNEFPSTDSSYNMSNLNKNEDRRFSLYTLQSSLNNNNSHNSTSSLNSTTTKSDMPKVDITERKQLFETGKVNSGSSRASTTVPDELSHSKSIKERLKHLEKCTEESLNIKKATKLLTGDIMTVRDRLSSLVSHTTNIERNNNIPSWSSTSQLTDSNDKAMRKAEIEQNDHDQRINNNSNTMISSFSHMDKGRMFHCSLDSLDIRCGDTNPDTCTLEHVQSLDGLDYCERSNYPPSGSSTELLALSQCGDTDREDSGIQTADVSCSVSQADDPDEDSDTMAAVNTVCVEQHLIHTDDPPNPLKTYLSSIEYSPQESSMPTSPEVTDTTSNATTKSDTSLMVEDLITCTINMNLGNKIVFDDITSDIPTVVPLDPLAPPRSVEPPKEKPPPPPVDVASDNDESSSITDNTEHELKRLNSTKRIKNEIRNKRSSFLGIEGVSDISDLELTVSKPPNAATILQEELQLEKELYKQSQSFHQNSIDLANAHAEVESRDSGVELESRSASEQFPISDTVDGNIKTNEEDEITKKEREIIENLEKEERWRHNYNKNRINKGPSTVLNSYYYDDNHCSPQNSTVRDEKDDSRYQDDEDVIRVERELLELEQEELERQREDMLYQNRKANLLNSVPKSGSIGILDTYIRKPGRPDYPNNNYTNYYHSTPVPTPSTPANRSCTLNTGGYNTNKIAQLPVTSPPIAPPKPIRLSGSTSSDSIITDMPNQMSRHTLHALSATPKSKLMTTDSWIQSSPATKKTPMTLTTTHDRDYNQHWLIQEAEERRLTDRANRNLISTNNNTNNNFISRHSTIEKHIPDSVVHTLTQRIQNRSNLREKSHLINRKDIPVPRVSSTLLPTLDRTRPPTIPNTSMTTMPSVVQSPPLAPIPSPPSVYDFHDKMLSVSGKKKCSHCGDELGRGAAMIIESLCLFYHMDCFKCCVCHVQLGDGLMGTDVRVRNHKLHCHNCYSSDDGVKFSCV